MTIPKVHIRDLFWLLLVVGMGCAWWIDHHVYAERDAWLWDTFIESSKRDEEWQRATGLPDPEAVSEGRREKWLTSQE